MWNWKSVKEHGIPRDEKEYLVTHFDGETWADAWLEHSYVCLGGGNAMWETCGDGDITHYAEIVYPKTGEQKSLGVAVQENNDNQNAGMLRDIDALMHAAQSVIRIPNDKRRLAVLAEIVNHVKIQYDKARCNKGK